MTTHLKKLKESYCQRQVCETVTLENEKQAKHCSFTFPVVLSNTDKLLCSYQQDR